MNITAKNLVTGYGGKPVFPAFSVEAKSAELVVLLGKNGVGKSTLLRTLAGLLPPLSGKVIIGDRNLAQYSTRERAMTTGFVSTERFKVANLSVFDVVAMGRYSCTNWIGSLDSDDRRAIARALEMSGAMHLAGKKINETSDGELQRVMIARTLAQETPVIILDEPTAFLDFPNKFDILMLLRNLAWNSNKTVILSTHDLDLAMRFADNIWLMADGCLTQGAPEDMALNRQFDRIFANACVEFNYFAGTIDTRTLATHEIAVRSSDPLVEFWTAKALARLGFKKVDNADLAIEIHNNRFILHRQQSQQSFADIYSLSRAIRS
ncbi:MAG: ABC transporter ATP-binding protein [Prevotellaceae bacterium]|jgi:iron complex transport system ATP-binding protein|nr:ABC transporter ATP-binding protein [Prevotellaceae bacterium]